MRAVGAHLGRAGCMGLDLEAYAPHPEEVAEPARRVPLGQHTFELQVVFLRVADAPDGTELLSIGDDPARASLLGRSDLEEGDVALSLRDGRFF